MSEHFARRAADELQRGLGRRTFFRAATAVAAAGAVTGKIGRASCRERV